MRSNDIDEWLSLVHDIKKDKLRNGVHASTFFTVRKSDKKIVGSFQVRHFLTDELKKHGGHIGYAISPSERKKAYGKEQLKLALDVCKTMKILNVLLICNSDNKESIRTILSCGGSKIESNIHNKIEQDIYQINL